MKEVYSMKRVNKPKADENFGCIIDISYEQFAESGDEPDISISVDDNIYDESCSKLLRKQAQFMLKAADWLEYRNNRTKK